jgi:hypothetical protein
MPHTGSRAIIPEGGGKKKPKAKKKKPKAKKKPPPLTPYQKSKIRRKIRGVRGGGRDPRGPTFIEELKRSIDKQMG